MHGVAESGTTEATEQQQQPSGGLVKRAESAVGKAEGARGSQRRLKLVCGTQGRYQLQHGQGTRGRVSRASIPTWVMNTGGWRQGRVSNKQ